MKPSLAIFIQAIHIYDKLQYSQAFSKVLSKSHFCDLKSQFKQQLIQAETKIQYNTATSMMQDLIRSSLYTVQQIPGVDRIASCHCTQQYKCKRILHAVTYLLGPHQTSASFTLDRALDRTMLSVTIPIHHTAISLLCLDKQAGCLLKSLLYLARLHIPDLISILPDSSVRREESWRGCHLNTSLQPSVLVLVELVDLVLSIHITCKIICHKEPVVALCHIIHTVCQVLRWNFCLMNRGLLWWCFAVQMIDNRDLLSCACQTLLSDLCTSHHLRF